MDQSTQPNYLPYLISLLVGQALQFLLSIFQSVKSNHFNSKCFGCTVDNQYEGKDKPTEP